MSMRFCWLLMAAVLAVMSAAPLTAQEPATLPSSADELPADPAVEAREAVRTLLDAATRDLVELRFEKSLSSLDALLSRTDLTASERVEGITVRSQAHVALGDLDAAEEDYRQLLRLRPGFAPDSAPTPGKAMERFRRVRGALVGEIVVEIQPADAELWIDGVQVESTSPLELPMLVGEHRLRAVREGFDEAAQSVAVEPGKSARVQLRLVPNSRTLVVRTDPAGVEVRIDGRLRGSTSVVPGAGNARDAGQTAQLVVEHLALGEHLIELSRPCFREKRFRELLTVDLVEWSPRVLPPAVMAPVSSSLVVVDGPAGAEIFVDGKSMSRTPSRPIELCPGESELEIRYGGRRIWSQSLTLGDDREEVVRLAARPNVAILGEQAWPEALVSMASSFNLETRPRPGGIDLSLARSWETLQLPGDVDLVLATRKKAGRDSGWWLYSPHLKQLSTLESMPRVIGRPDWQGVSWGMSLVDSERFGPAIVAVVEEGGPAAVAGVTAGARLMSLGGSQVASAAQSKQLLAAASSSAPLAAEWVMQSGRTGRGQLQGRISPSLKRASEDPTANAFRAAWGMVDSMTGGDSASIARANLALLLSGRGLYREAAELWQAVSFEDRPGIGQGTVAYYLGCDLQADGVQAEAIEAYRRAAGSEATTFGDDGPAVAAAARDRLRELLP